MPSDFLVYTDLPWAEYYALWIINDRVGLSCMAPASCIKSYIFMHPIIKHFFSVFFFLSIPFVPPPLSSHTLRFYFGNQITLSELLILDRFVASTCAMGEIASQPSDNIMNEIRFIISINPKST